MKKSYLFLATAIIALASCSENTYLGDQEGAAQGNGAISFGSNLPSLTRAGERTGSDAAGDLGYSFLVYATKTVGTATSNVFAQNAYSTSTNEPYWVWYTASTANQTASNTSNWEYVGTKTTNPTYGTTGNLVQLDKDQTIKYWDYSAKNYVFTAYKNKSGGTVSKLTTNGFSFNGTASQLAGLYVADKIILDATKATDPDVDNSPTKPATGYNKIGDIVQFTFRSAGAKVRLGIYETINGYNVQNVKFRPLTETGEGIEFPAATGSAKLSGTFNDDNNESTTAKDYDITYETSGKADVKLPSGGTTAKFFNFGSFVTTAIGESSTSPTWATGSTSYSSVFPNTDHAANMILKVDYQLYNENTGETINVKGAKAVVPQMYMTWKPNHAYTYLFKISDNTNGTTGTEGTNPEGLFPITFDAVTESSVDGEQGTITTITTPAITTYQNGSVSSTGITYASTKGAIYITVNENGTLAALTDKIKLYKLAAADANATEADLILVPSKLAGKEVTGEATDKLAILSGDGETVQGISFAATTSAKFTPLAPVSPATSTTYAVQYQVSAAVLYTLDEYNTAKGTSLDATAFAALSDEEKTKTPAVYQYKIIVVGS